MHDASHQERRARWISTFILAVAISAIGLAGCAASSRAQAREDDRIGFVRLMVTENGAALVEATSEPGRLKKRRGPLVPEAFTYEMLGPAGDILWTGSFEDPLVERVEYVDDNGQLNSRIVRKDQAEVLIRVPVTASRQTMRLYRMADAAEKDAAPVFAIIDVEF